MVTIHLACYVVAFVLFVVGACPTGSRFNWIGFGLAALTLTLIV